MISILTPTRERPENVRRLIASVVATAEQPLNVELLFYVDHDDQTFPQDVLSANVRLIRGPRMWLSLLQNVLYASSRGEIVMYAGDDLVFETFGWDTRVESVFESSNDKLVLVYPNDRATHGESMAIHGFLHRNWIDAIGCWVAPGRGSLYDLWHTEVARKLGRLRYLDDVVIAHVHYRQGSGRAVFDETYRAVSSATRSWVPMVTYRKLKRERRIDYILLSEKIKEPLKTDYNYVLAEWLVKNRTKLGFGSIDERRIRSMGNFEIIPVIIKNVFKLVTRKR